MKNYDGLRKIKEIASSESRDWIIWELKNESSGKRFAGKEVKKNEYRNFVKEIEMLRKISHENLVTVHDFSEDYKTGTVMIQMELCDCTLLDYVQDSFLERFQLKSKEYLNDLSKIEILQQIAYGVDYLHQMDIVHQSIKPQNILLKMSHGSVIAKLSDFGLCRQKVDENSGYLSMPLEDLVDDFFVAPEINSSLAEPVKYRQSCNIYSLGKLFFYVLTNGSKNIESYESLKFQTKLGLSHEQTVTACHLIRAMIDSDQSKRSSILNVLSHPLFWSSKKKISFFVQLHQCCLIDNAKSKELSSILKTYDELYLSKKKIAKNQPPEFVISKEKFSFSDLVFTTFSEPNCVAGLIRLIRNLDAHIQNPTSSKVRVRKIFSKNGEFSEDVFLEKLTGPFPPLLIHLYTVFGSRSEKDNVVIRPFYAIDRKIYHKSQILPLTEIEQDSAPCDQVIVVVSYYQSLSKVSNGRFVLKKDQSIQLCKENHQDLGITFFHLSSPNLEPGSKLASALDNLNKGFALSLDQESNLSLYRYECCRPQPFCRNHRGDYEKVNKESTMRVNYHFASNAGKCIVLGRDPCSSDKPAPITIHVTPHEIGDDVDNEESSVLLLSDNEE